MPILQGHFIGVLGGTTDVEQSRTDALQNQVQLLSLSLNFKLPRKKTKVATDINKGGYRQIQKHHKIKGRGECSVKEKKQRSSAHMTKEEARKKKKSV